MKIRTGFVSNSSSSSFLIYGVVLDSSKDYPKEIREEGDTYGAWEKLVEGTGLEIHYPYSGDCGNYLGCSWDSVGDDETGAQFKKRVEDALEKMLGKKVKCSTLSEAWHD